MLTVERLKELLHYDQDTGVFTNRVMRGGAKAGTVVGTSSARGYVGMRVDRQWYLAHNLAFLYMLCEMPPNDVSHINGKRNDNRWRNLQRV